MTPRLTIQEHERLVNSQILDCLNPNKLNSFFLFAGAGSGKTRSLVQVMEEFKYKYGKSFRIHGHKVGIITYTNAARDEIDKRLQYDPLFFVSTIHSFIWELIRPFQLDIKNWLTEVLSRKIAELTTKLQNGRTKNVEKLQKELYGKNSRLKKLKHINRFNYSPDGDNRNFNSLNHSEVIQIGEYFLTHKPLMQTVLINKYPILLIDESQDTNKHLMNALFEVQVNHKNNFALGLYGDTMQRIYSDGKHDLGHNLPNDWVKPEKTINHRCPQRVIKLINKIRKDVDNHNQEPGESNVQGTVRLFVCPNDKDKEVIEKKVSTCMARITQDSSWDVQSSDYKSLILEHHMAAKRLGFSDLFETLYSIDGLKDGLLNGNLAELNVFTEKILPIVEAHKQGDNYLISRIVNKYSPLLNIDTLKKDANSQLNRITHARKAVQELLHLWDNNSDPNLQEIIKSVQESSLFIIPDKISSIIKEGDTSYVGEDRVIEKDLNAWISVLNIPFSQIKAYNTYIKGDAKFETHQGVKGLEYPRVMVIIDDEDARGFMFSYDKLFGVKEKSPTDVKNEQEGRDSTIERTKRLFYVTCSRAQDSLAIIAYSKEPKLIKQHLVSEGWFNESEIIYIE